MATHSHIQLPHTVIRRFRDETDKEKKVWYLDIPTNTIRRKPSGRLGTEIGYYSQDGENYWNKVIENSIGKLNEKILSFCKGDINAINISQREKDIVKRYIKSAIVRSSSTYESIKSIIINCEDYTEQNLHDAVSVIGMTVVEEIAEVLNFDDLVATVLVNRTDWNFVVPRNCYYCVQRGDYPNFIMPISPTGALLLLPKMQLTAEYGNYAVIDAPEQIKRLNKYALKFESLFNGDFVACNSRFELEELQKVLLDPPW